jgi:CHRD domain
MRLKISALVVAAAAFAALAVPAIGAVDDAELQAKLKGKEEVPGPGDNDGKGEAQLETKIAKSKLCYLVEYEDIGTATAAHVHKGPKGEAGKIVIPLFEEQTESPAEDCIKVEKDRTLKKIVKNPSDYYVNVHNEEFPEGAIRGQLKIVGGGENGTGEDNPKP